MSWVFWLLIIITAALASGCIYRIAVGVRRYNLDRDKSVNIDFDMSAEEQRAAKTDTQLLQWAVFTGALAIMWGAGELVVKHIGH